MTLVAQSHLACKVIQHGLKDTQYAKSFGVSSKSLSIKIVFCVSCLGDSEHFGQKPGLKQIRQLHETVIDGMTKINCFQRSNRDPFTHVIKYYDGLMFAIQIINN